MIKKTDAGDWREAIERERLSMEKIEAEFRKNETVARLAIELGRNGPGRGGKKFTPDLDSAARMMTDAASARQRELERPDREPKEIVEDLLNEFLNDRSLKWHPAKKQGAKSPPQGSGGVVNCSVLCNPKAEPDVNIYIGEYRCSDFDGGFIAESSDELKWHPISKWQVLRDVERFRRICMDAVKLQLCDEIKRNPKLKLRTVTDADVSKILELSEISSEFFRALVAARENLPNPNGKGSAGGEAKPPRGKTAKS